jgi:membrane protein implicated in regulation of membrane protease activity
MPDMNMLGKILLLFGAVLVAAGILLMLGAKLSWFGRLPGDIYIQKKSFTFFFPITTSIIISIILSIILILLRRR